MQSEDVRQIANDLGISVGELRTMSAKNPHAADLLVRMLTALSVDSEALARRDPATMRDLQRLCTSCGHKGRCAHELAEGTAAEHFQSFCPNAFTLDALLKSKERLALIVGSVQLTSGFLLVVSPLRFFGVSTPG
jgi:hypothetical protein